MRKAQLGRKIWRAGRQVGCSLPRWSGGARTPTSVLQLTGQHCAGRYMGSMKRGMEGGWALGEGRKWTAWTLLPDNSGRVFWGTEMPFDSYTRATLAAVMRLEEGKARRVRYGCVRGCGRSGRKKGLWDAGHFTVAHRQEATGFTPADNKIYNHTQNLDSSPGWVYQMWFSTPPPPNAESL